jgi:hypothetical protein
MGLGHANQSVFQVVGLEAERAGFTFVGDVAARVDHVHSIWPSRVCVFSRVAKFIQDRGDFYSQPSDTCSGNEGALVLSFGRSENDIVFYVALHLPDVTGVGLSNVDDQERDLASVLFVELV